MADQRSIRSANPRPTKEWNGGLPQELWRIVISYLPVASLCVCSQVCKSWHNLVDSLDNTTWKRYFMMSREWKHPQWPKFTSPEDLQQSWQRLYKEHIIAARFWSRVNIEPDQANCLNVFRRRNNPKTIRVGPAHEHTTLRSALNVASDYDRILIAPGIYDEQFEMSAKIPFELMGSGELGSVILVMCIEQNSLTGRLCNLVIKAPWFTAHVIRVSIAG
jgi:F-box protein 10